MLFPLLGFKAFVLNDHDDIDNFDVELFDGFHFLNGLILLNFLFFLPELFFEGLGLLLILFDKVLDFLLVEIL